MKKILLKRRGISDDLIEKVRDAAGDFTLIVESDYKKALEEVKDVEVVAGDVENDLIRGGDRLKWVHVWSAGVDGYDQRYMKENNIILTNSSGVHKVQIPEYVFGVMLELVKKLHNYSYQQKNKVWHTIETEELYRKTLGVLGIGDIGERVAQLAKAFGMRVFGYRRFGKPSDYVDIMYSEGQLDDMLPLCDIVVSTLPLTEETHHLLGKKQFEIMKDTAYFINIGRGKVVDEPSLIDALNNGIIKGAALDVFESEPLPPDSPLWDMENVIITPHISGLTPHYDERAIEIFIENLKRYKSGMELLNKVDFARGY